MSTPVEPPEQTLDQTPAMSRDAVLDGLHGRRASTTRFAIEARTARLALHASQVCAPPICEDAVEARESALLSAISGGRELDRPPTIQELERFAPDWASLVAADATTRAATARALGDDRRFRRSDVPQLREALGLDTDAVDESFERLTGSRIDSLYADRLDPIERYRWLAHRVSTRIDRLPPVWTAFALTLTQTVGAGVLALPIALARIGPLGGVAVLAVMGLVNVVTIVSIAEAFTRTGEVRWSSAWFGGVVRTHLGAVAAQVVTIGLAALSSVLLMAYYLGFGATLGDATPVPSAVWVVALASVGALVVHRRRLRGAATTALFVGAVNVLAILVLATIALSDLDRSRFTAGVAPGSGGLLDADVVGLVFGVVLLSYFGHTSIGSCAKSVLDRDPGGRSLIRGVAAAMATATVLYVIWVVAVGGGIDADVLAAETSTALTPLADRHGLAVVVIGSVLAVGSMGMASVQFAFGLGDLVRERMGGTRNGVATLAPVAPVAAAAAAAIVLLVSDGASFAGPLGVVGALTVPVLAGVLPVLLALAARQNGDHVPDGATPRSRGPVVLATAAAICWLALVAHATIIWQSWPERLAAGGTAVGCVLLVGSVVRSGAIRVPSLVVQVRHDRDVGATTLETTNGGTHWSGDVHVTERSGHVHVVPMSGPATLPRRSAELRFEIGDEPARLRVWHHSVDVLGTSRAQPVSTDVDGSSLVVTLDTARTPT